MTRTTEMTLEQAENQLTAREFNAFAWLWMSTPRFGHHPHASSCARIWRRAFSSNEQATEAANRALAHRNRGPEWFVEDQDTMPPAL